MTNGVGEGRRTGPDASNWIVHRHLLGRDQSDPKEQLVPASTATTQQCKTNDLSNAWATTTAELVTFVRRRVESSQVAEDIVQDVLERLQRAEPGEISNPQAWLYRSARNATIDHYRTRRQHDPVNPDQVDERYLDSNEPNAATRELAQCLRPLITQLPDKYRAALTLVDLEGLTNAIAAESAGISVSGMKSRVQRGRAKLGQQLRACCAVSLSGSGAIDDYTPSEACGCA